MNADADKLINADADKLINADADKLINADADLIRVEIRFNRKQVDWLKESALISGIAYKSISDLIYKIVTMSTDVPDRYVLPPNSRGQGRKVGSKNKPKKSKSKRKTAKKIKLVQLDLLKDNQ
jgi:hypothetical protein